MKISIITVCYNSEATIENTFQSVAEQTYTNIEYIVVDGGSLDGTQSIIKKYDKNIDNWISEPDKGIFDAMNKGVLMATGDVIGILNSDDVFYDKFSIEKVMHVFEYEQNLDAVYADLYYVSQHNTDKIVRRWVTGKQRKFSSGWHPGHPTFYVKKKIYDSFGLYNTKLKLASDFEIMLRFIEKHKINIFYLQEPIVKMRLGGASNNSLKGLYIQNIECLQSFKLNGIRVNNFLYPFYRLLPKLLQFNNHDKI